jgi:hypothetical protein
MKESWRDLVGAGWVLAERTFEDAKFFAVSLVDASNGSL